jgi:oxygen-independent coproporphyrinogen-3 oxidase
MQKSIFINWPLGRSNDLLLREYQTALCLEIERDSSYFKQPIETLYLAAPRANGVGIKCLLDTSGTLIKTVTFAEHPEYSLEIGQIPLLESEVAAWQHAGINRVVIQYNEDSLVHIEQLRKNVDTITRYIKNISVDLYTACANTISIVSALPITHISLYTVTDFSSAKKIIEDAGFVSYEWQHFARNGFASKHALNYWNHGLYKGFGAGACSFDGECRTKNSDAIQDYLDCIQRNQLSYSYEERLSAQEIYFEKIMMGLRKPQGVCKQLISPETKERMDDLIVNGFLIDRGETVGYTDRGFLVENEILTQIIN